MKVFHRTLALKLPISSASASAPMADTHLPQVLLPPELWSYILSFLPDPEMLRVCATNRIFYDLAMDRQYKHCEFPYFQGCRGSDLLHVARNPTLAKRIKVVNVSTLYLFPISFPVAPGWRSKILRFLIPTVLRRRISTTGRNATLAVPPQDVASLNTNVDRILDILSMAENLQKIGVHFPIYESHNMELDFITALSSLLHDCNSIYYLSLRLQYAKLDWVLPLMHFRGLREVRLYIYMRASDNLPGSPRIPGIFLQFLEYLEPSLEALTVWVFDYEFISQISQSLCHEGAIMRKVRELSTRLSFQNPHAFDAISTNYPLVTKLALTPVIDMELPPFLEHLRLPDLRTLRLWMPESLPGFWRGSCSSPLLDELHVTTGDHMPSEEVARLCQFFSCTKITRISISVEVLDARLIDLLARSFPDLRSVALHVKHLMQSRQLFEERDLSSFREEMRERRYPELRELRRFSVSFYGSDTPAAAVISILAESLPNVEFENQAIHFIPR
ncbi:F-box domain-containing protein [Pleurotus pulmonarius]